MSSSASYLPGTASLLEELDKRLLVLLRDGRTLIGYLRSVDQVSELRANETTRQGQSTERGHTTKGVLHAGFPLSLQFANLVLHRCIERIHVGKDFGDIPRGIFVVRGENVVSA